MTEANQKSALRKTLKQRRNGMTAAFRHSAAERALDHLVDHPAWQRATTVALYRAAGSELDPSSLPERASAARKRFVYPRVEAEGVMSFRDPGSPEHFELSPLGIEQPDAQASEVSADTIDLLIVPLLGWDDRGYRLGYGGGFYDRYLATTQADRIGIAFSSQQIPEVPAETHDVILDWLVSDSGVYRFGQRLSA